MRTVRYFFLTTALAAVAALPALAQPIMSAKSGIIASVQGKVLLDNKDIEQSETRFPEIKEGSTLRTEDGRAEVMLPPGYMLRLGENGSLKMLTTRLSDTRLELLSGSAVVEVDQASSNFSVTIAMKDATVTLDKVGVYRFDVAPGQVKVFHGMATVQLAGKEVPVGTGRMLTLSGASASAEKFDVTETDSLDNWSRRQASAMALASVSSANPANRNRGGVDAWWYNSYLGMYTFVPMGNRMCNPYYGVCYYSPQSVYQTYYAQPYYPSNNNSGFSASNPQMSGSSSNSAASVMSSPTVSVQSAPAAVSSSSTAASSAASSAGHGAATSGGHGK